ncbi:alpha/beta hydrolase [bacterium]|nr:alpha/beta hydrolase [bacterium]
MCSPPRNFFVEEGYAVVTPNYRLAPTYPHPTPLNDIFCAYAWTLTHADDYGFDLTRLVLIGESAGGNAAAMLASVDAPQTYLTDCAYAIPPDIKPQAAVLYYTPLELSTCVCRTAKQFAALYLGLEGYEPSEEEAMRKRAVDASPLPWLDGNEPPFLLFHGTEDTLIPISESELFVESVQAAGGQADLIVVPEAEHGFFARPAYPYVRDSWQTVIEFLYSLGS